MLHTICTMPAQSVGSVRVTRKFLGFIPNILINLTGIVENDEILTYSYTRNCIITSS